MRIPALLLVVPLLLPSVLTAQLRPRPRIAPGSADPSIPQPMPPQAEPVARVVAYQRLRLAVESFPLVTHVRAPGLRDAGGFPSWTSVGTGMRADYRIDRRWAAVGEYTGAWAGSPMVLHTLELGTRFRPVRLEGRMQPFIDARGTWALAYRRQFAVAEEYGSGIDSRAMRGLGALGGVGAEYSLTPTWSAVAGTALMYSRVSSMSAFDERTRTVGLTTVRLSLGMRYTRTRLVMPRESGGS